MRSPWSRATRPTSRSPTRPTSPVRSDLARAGLAARTGLGFDVHRLGPGDGLVLLGVRLEGPLRLIGHSDADVGLHALTDALLGTLGAGDIGSHFPPSEARWAAPIRRCSSTMPGG